MTDFCDEMGMTTLFDNLLNNPNDSYSFEELAGMSHRREYRDFIRKHPEYKEIARRIRNGQNEERNKETSSTEQRKERLSDSYTFLKNRTNCKYFVLSAHEPNKFYCLSQEPERMMECTGKGEGAELYHKKCRRADKEGVPPACPYYVDDSEEDAMYDIAILCDNVLNDMYNNNVDAQHNLSLRELVEMRAQDIYIKFMRENSEYAEVAKLVSKQ